MDLIGLYPTWFEPGLGSGWIVGLIATIHVLFSHTSVGIIEAERFDEIDFEKNMATKLASKVIGSVFTGAAMVQRLPTPRILLGCWNKHRLECKLAH